jgi:hypothetical protein
MWVWVTYGGREILHDCVEPVLFPVFSDLIKNMTEEVKLFSPSSYVGASRVLE